MKNNKNSKIVFFDQLDLESYLILYVFKNTEFINNPMNGKPTKFDYLELKDNLIWQNLKPQNYANLLKHMARTYIRHLPTN